MDTRDREIYCLLNVLQRFETSPPVLYRSKQAALNPTIWYQIELIFHY